eukprot:scaffold85421_cov75-Phaeocystis_antarctica.AAC.1
MTEKETFTQVQPVKSYNTSHTKVPHTHTGTLLSDHDHAVADGQVHATMGLKGQGQLRGQPTVGIKHVARRHCTAP